MFLWVANFWGLTTGFVRLPTLLRTFIAGYIYLTKNTGFFTRGGIYPFFLYPTHVFFISFFFYATVRLILNVVPFIKPTIEHQTQCRPTMSSQHTIKHKTQCRSLPCTHNIPSNTKHSVDLYYALIPRSCDVPCINAMQCYCMYLMSHA